MSESKTIKVAHIIDTLNAGGSEQMAINFVNGLVDKNFNTLLIVTRNGGILESKVNKQVKLHIINKKTSFDIKSFIKINKLLIKNNINILHAHSSSILWASLLKIINKKLVIIWHDHYGNSEQLEKRPYFLLKQFAPLWSFTFSVNEKLKDWSIKKLGVNPNSIKFLNNFATLSNKIEKIGLLEQLDIRNSINIVCVANLRPQKDHKNLMKAFEIVCAEKGNVFLHLIGVNPNDDYSNSILKMIKEHKNKDRIYFWNAQQNISSWLNYMDIGVLSSFSEGLPVSLLEYGLAGLAVVSTEVGQIAEVLGKGKYGSLVPPNQPNMLANCILDVIDNASNSRAKSILFKQHILQFYSEDVVIKELINIYRLII